MAGWYVTTSLGMLATSFTCAIFTANRGVMACFATLAMAQNTLAFYSPMPTLTFVIVLMVNGVTFSLNAAPIVVTWWWKRNAEVLINEFTLDVTTIV